jgi:hypothetical protein
MKPNTVGDIPAFVAGLMVVILATVVGFAYGGLRGAGLGVVGGLFASVTVWVVVRELFNLFVD